MSHACGHNQLSLQGFSSTSICIHFNKSNVMLIPLCLQRRFSIMATYFYMEIKFSTCWFNSCFLLCMSQGSQKKENVYICSVLQCGIFFTTWWQQKHAFRVKVNPTTFKIIWRISCISSLHSSFIPVPNNDESGESEPQQ